MGSYFSRSVRKDTSPRNKSTFTASSARPSTTGQPDHPFQSDLELNSQDSSRAQAASAAKDLARLARIKRSRDPLSPITDHELTIWAHILCGKRLVTNGETTSWRPIYPPTEIMSPLWRRVRKARSEKAKRKAMAAVDAIKAEYREYEHQVRQTIPAAETFDTNDLPEHWWASGQPRRDIYEVWVLNIWLDEYGVVEGIGFG